MFQKQKDKQKYLKNFCRALQSCFFRWFLFCQTIVNNSIVGAATIDDVRQRLEW